MKSRRMNLCETETMSTMEMRNVPSIACIDVIHSEEVSPCLLCAILQVPDPRLRDQILCILPCTAVFDQIFHPLMITAHQHST
jgi:hypothetical protein